MTWFKVDDGFHKHRKRVRVGVSMEGFAAIGLWTVAGSWSSDEPTGGFIPADVVEYLAPGFGEDAAKRLVAAGLWDQVDGGYRYHDWTGYNPSLEEAVAALEKMSTGGAIGNHRRWHVQAGRVDPQCRYCRENANRPGSGTRSGGRSASGNTNPDTNPMPESRNSGKRPDRNDQGPDQRNHRVPDRGAIGVPESPPSPPDPSRPDNSSLSARTLLTDQCGLTERETTKLLELIHTSRTVGNEDAFVRTLVNNGTIDGWITKTRAALDDDQPRHRLPVHDFEADKTGFSCAYPRCGMREPHANHKTGSNGTAA